MIRNIKRCLLATASILALTPENASAQENSIIYREVLTYKETMMGGYSAEIGSGPGELTQTIRGLAPSTTYELMAMLRLPAGESARLGVRDHGQSPLYCDSVKDGAPRWTRRTLRFTTGPQHASAIIVIEKHSNGPGAVYIDDPGLQLVETTQP